MSRVIAWEDIRPGMRVYMERRPVTGYPECGWPMSLDLECYEISDRLPNGRLRYRLDGGFGRLVKPDPADVRFWTNGCPYPQERIDTPWTEVVRDEKA